MKRVWLYLLAAPVIAMLAFVIGFFLMIFGSE